MPVFKTRFLLPVFVSMIIATGCAESRQGSALWMSDPDAGVLFRQQEAGPEFVSGAGSGTVIRIDTAEKFQQVDGFGWALTGGSAQHIIRMDAKDRARLLHALFSTADSSIGGSYVRLSIGASDLNEKVFSYNDLPAGETDTALLKFDLGPDKLDVIPVMKEILAINPDIRVMGSPWSPPVWMKDNNDTRGGSLKPAYYDVYARYFVRYIREMAKEGIRIDAVTVQNEPLHPGNNPSLLMPAEQQLVFVRDHLGPVFRKEGITTKIILYDHNCDKPEYPIAILNDPEAKKYIDGSAFHLYAGEITALSAVHDAHPDRNLYFTEQWVGAPGDMPRDLREHTRNLTIGAMRNWSKTVIEWNLAADPQSDPHTDRGGCDRCLGAVTIDKNAFTRNPAYYTIAHLARFVRPGSIRIGSNSTKELPNVAFKTTEGKLVLLVLNDTDKEMEFSIENHNTHAPAKLRAGAIGTYVF